MGAIGNFLLDDESIATTPLEFRFPIAAKDEAILEDRVGRILSRRKGRAREASGRARDVNALVLRPRPMARPSAGHAFLDFRRSQELYGTDVDQYWVHVDNDGYRPNFEADMPTVEIDGLDLDHVLSRKLAREFHLRFIRLYPVDPDVNQEAGRELEAYLIKTILQDRGADASLSCLPQGDPAPGENRLVYAGAFALAKMLWIPPGDRDCLGGVQQVLWAMQNHDRGLAYRGLARPGAD